jgi:tetratricopeptide (TPR) repeat protein/DNA-binding CsgD family transcriptional regulator
LRFVDIRPTGYFRSMSTAPTPRSNPPTHAPVTVLTIGLVRELGRSSRAGGMQSRIEQSMLYRIPIIHQSGADEMAELMRQIIDAWMERMRRVGIEPPADAIVKEQRISMRERRNVLGISALLTHEAVILEDVDQLDAARARAYEALAWSELAHDHRQSSVVWRVLGSIAEKVADLDEEERCLSEAVRRARLDGQPIVVADALNDYCSHLTARARHDEATAVNDESMELTRGWPNDDHHRIVHAATLQNRARILIAHSDYAGAITLLRSALEWVDGGVDPKGRAALLTHLGSIYLRLQQYQPAIECHHEVVRLGCAIGSRLVTAWGYFRLAEAYVALDDLEAAGEALRSAADQTTEANWRLHFSIGLKHAQVYIATQRHDVAARLCQRLLEEMREVDDPNCKLAANIIMADADSQRGELASAEEALRTAIEITQRSFPERVPQPSVRLARLLARQHRDDEALELLDDLGLPDALNTTERVASLRVRATVAERRGDFAIALQCEREAASLELSLMKSRSEQHLYNARMLAEIDVLEREAQRERERRHQLSRELASAVVELDDRRRLVERVEERLQVAIDQGAPRRSRPASGLLTEVLSELRTHTSEHRVSPGHLENVDGEFYRTLRERCVDLTPKQERLCALIASGLSSRDIEALLGVGAEAVKAQRKRLRRKLGLAHGEQLETLLSAMTRRL